MSKKNEMVDVFLKNFTLSNDVLRRVSLLLLDNFTKGLDIDKHATASVKMLPTFVRDTTRGDEEGTYLAVDLGGSHFRILRIDLHGRCFNMDSKIYEIPPSVMVGSGDDLFDHICKCLDNHLEQFGLKTALNLSLGFTFSFPCTQTSLTSAVLLRWTKGFACSGVVGQDVAQLFQNALERRGITNIKVIAVLNDTTGTLMSCAHTESDCAIGLIIGTGTNTCYIEKLKNVGCWTEDYGDPDQVIINTEWGAFGDDGCLDFLRTNVDKEVDDTSLNKGKQLFEKMISGMYMGEIVRRIVCQIVASNLMFQGDLPYKFSVANSFKSKFLSFVENDWEDEMQETKEVLKKMGVAEACKDDCRILKAICTFVSTRSAHLVSAGVVTLLNKMKRSKTVVGVDGSVYRFHPHYKTIMESKIHDLVDPDYKFELMLSEDGSGRGAALVAAVAQRIAIEQNK